MNKNTYQDIINYINNKETGNGCTLLTTEEEFEKEKTIQNKTNTTVKLKIQCGCKKNLFYFDFHRFKRSNKICLECSKQNNINLHRNEWYNHVKNYIEIESNSGCKLLSTEYMNNYTNLKVQCSCGKTFEVNFSDFKSKRRYKCQECNGFWNIDKIKQRTKDSAIGYECLSIEYKSEKKLLFKCDKGHKFKCEWRNFNIHNQRCPLCADANRKFNYNKIKNNIESIDGYKLLSEEYIGCDEKLELQCPSEHIFSVTYSHFINDKSRCSVCKALNHRGSGGSNWQGGITPLHNYLRDKLGKWKKDSLRQYNYKCYFTKEWSKDLEIHHTKSFSDILQETVLSLSLPVKLQVSEYSIEEIHLLEDKCLELHYKYGLGIPLRKDIHVLFHQQYGYDGNTTEEDFKEFEQRYDSGEFNEILKNIV